MGSHTVSAWTELITNSTALPGSTAWVHLTSQEGGGSGPGLPFPIDNIEVEILTQNIEVGIETPKLTVTTRDLEVAINTRNTEFTVEILDNTWAEVQYKDLEVNNDN